MTTAIKDLFQEVIDVTTDDASVRWTLPMLARYYNAGFLALVEVRPDASSADEDFTCADGARQTLPTGTTQLMEVRHNVSHASKAAITPARREELDAAAPGWHASAKKTFVRHSLYDERDDLHFEVWPPVSAGVVIRILRGVTPTLMAIPASDVALAAIPGNCSFPDKYRNAMREYILFRCYDLDADGQSNPMRAANHYGRWAQELGIELQAKLLAAPKNTAPQQGRA